jgi:hypothetical protein
MPIKLQDPIFSFGDATQIAEMEAGLLNNWLAREIIDFGTMNRSGRRMYSIVDLIKLTIIAELNRTLQMRPTFAAAIAESVVPRALEIAALDENGKLKFKEYRGLDDEPHFLIARAEPQDGKFHVMRIKYSKLSPSLVGLMPMIVVPLDYIAIAVAQKCLALLDMER